MRRTVLTTCLVASVYGCGGSTPALDEAAVQQEVAASFEALATAIVDHDWDLVSTFLAEGEGTVFATDGTITSGHSQIMAVFRGLPDFTYLDYRFDDTSVQVVDANAAVQSTTFWERLAYTAGDTVEVRGAWSNVFQRIDGEWRVVHMASSHIPANP